MTHATPRKGFRTRLATVRAIRRRYRVGVARIQEIGHQSGRAAEKIAIPATPSAAKPRIAGFETVQAGCVGRSPGRRGGLDTSTQRPNAKAANAAESIRIARLTVASVGVNGSVPSERPEEANEQGNDHEVKEESHQGQVERA